jgi:glycosyltransferase involved in cell wall biosynthesis
MDRSKKNYINKKQNFSAIKNLTIVPVSNWLGGIVQNSFLKDKRVNVIQNGIDIRTFQPIASNSLIEQYNLAVKRIILGVASPWSSKKGLRDFVKLYDGVDSTRYQIVLIGLNKEQIQQLPNGILGLERTNSVEELAKWYSATNVFVNLTYEDTYPTTNLEAISCGTPVVTYRTGGSPESVTPQTGRVVEQGNIEAVAKAIEELCAEDRDAMRTRCREYAVAHFDKQECFKKYLDLYEEIIRKNK